MRHSLMEPFSNKTPGWYLITHDFGSGDIVGFDCRDIYNDIKVNFTKYLYTHVHVHGYYAAWHVVQDIYQIWWLLKQVWQTCCTNNSIAS